jgi:hypothetical protein
MEPPSIRVLSLSSLSIRQLFGVDLTKKNRPFSQSIGQLGQSYATRFRDFIYVSLKYEYPHCGGITGQEMPILSLKDGGGAHGELCEDGCRTMYTGSP